MCSRRRRLAGNVYVRKSAGNHQRHGRDKPTDGRPAHGCRRRARAGYGRAGGFASSGRLARRERKRGEMLAASAGSRGYGRSLPAHVVGSSGLGRGAGARGRHNARQSDAYPRQLPTTHRVHP